MRCFPLQKANYIVTYVTVFLESVYEEFWRDRETLQNSFVQKSQHKGIEMEPRFSTTIALQITQISDVHHNMSTVKEKSKKWKTNEALRVYLIRVPRTTQERFLKQNSPDHLYTNKLSLNIYRKGLTTCLLDLLQNFGSSILTQMKFPDVHKWNFRS